jgi:predicted HicB family RNase H-like nuclease
MPTSLETKRKTVHVVAQAFFNRGPDWVTFFREVLGVNGVVRTVFTEPKLLAEFESTPEYAEIQLMLTKLREQVDVLPPKEATKVITVRLPQSLHEALAAEAEAYHTSVNKLCISKLTQIIDEEYIPNGKAGPAKADAAADE